MASDTARFDPHPLRVAAAAKGDHTVKAISDRLDTPYGTVRRWTSGSSIPTGPALADIERQYGVTPATLFPADDMTAATLSPTGA